MRSPVLTFQELRRALGISEGRTRELISTLQIPTMIVDSTVLVDAGVRQRAVARVLGEAAAVRIAQARGGGSGLSRDDARPVTASAPVQSASLPATPAFENVETMMRAAIAAHGGVLTVSLYRTWAVETGRKPRDSATICRELGVKTWDEARALCGGRPGWITPSVRAEAFSQIVAAAAAYGGELTSRGYRAWATARGGRWRSPARVAQAAGYPDWSSALAAVTAHIQAGGEAASGPTGDAT